MMRLMLRYFLVVGCFSCDSNLLGEAPVPTREKTSRIEKTDRGHLLLVGARTDHPYGSHMYAFECELLKTCIEQASELQVTILPHWPMDATSRSDQEDRELTVQIPHFDRLKGIVFYSNPTGEKVLSPQHRDTFRQWMKEGVGLVAIHWGTGVGYSKLADAEELRIEFQQQLGGWFRRPPGDVTIGIAPLAPSAPDHPILRGWNVEKVRDEFYLRPSLHPQVQPLLTAEIDGQAHVVAWAWERPTLPNNNEKTPKARGRSVGITLGHFHETFKQDNFRRLVVNSILWATHAEVPQEGARVDVAPDQLVLPPPTPQNVPK